ncbi:hypothetical protein [Candidatus Leptofilum sp.]|uniref:hypothetical protein n=1 Tax=Candidatus Leptofilum sp. TaxID=3241576 RepID=UPI003B5934BD
MSAYHCKKFHLKHAGRIHLLFFLVFALLAACNVRDAQPESNAASSQANPPTTTVEQSESESRATPETFDFQTPTVTKPVASLTAVATKETGEPTPTIIQNPPTPSVEPINFELSLVYAETDTEKAWQSQIWVWDSSTNVTTLVYETQPGNAILFDRVRWDPNGEDTVYFTQISQTDRSWALFRLSLNTGDLTQVGPTFDSGIGFISEWSPNGQWLQIEQSNVESGVPEFEANILVNLANGETQVSQFEKIAWSANSQEIVAYRKPETPPLQLELVAVPGGDVLNIYSLVFPATEATERIQLGFYPQFSFVWHSEADAYYLVSNTTSNNRYELLLLDSQSGELIRQQIVSNVNYTPKLSLSPDGRWLLVDGHNQMIQVFHTATLDHQPLRFPSDSYSPFLGWVENSNLFLFRSGDSLFVAGADRSFPPHLLIDLSEDVAEGIRGVGIRVQIVE